ncbi:MAG: hypothetical protein ACLFUE_02945 [Desulfobacteraceae bacterium]
MTTLIEHYLNPLHIYCRLRDLGLGKRPARFICCHYERIIFRRYLMADGKGC